MSTHSKSIVKAFFGLTLMVLLLLNSSCGYFLGKELYDLINGGGGGGGGESENYSPTAPAIEATSTYAIALGGIAPGRDELILTDDGGNLLDLTGTDLMFKSDTNVIGFLPRPDFDDYESSSGAKIVPQEVGFAVISYFIDDVEQEDKFLVIVPPQSLIQMMVAEASTQLTGEAVVDDNSHVKLDSVSKTANAIGAATRNRVTMIDNSADHSLFNVDEYAWLLNPPASLYDSVIMAESSGIYQYFPVNPDDPANETFVNAEARSFLDPALHRAYDQAVLSAAHIFANDTADPTEGSFGFFSPTTDEWSCIENAYNNGMITLPSSCGISNDDFPSLSPVQVVVIESSWKYPAGRPAFIFVRSRNSSEYSVVKTP